MDIMRPELLGDINTHSRCTCGMLGRGDHIHGVLRPRYDRGGIKAGSTGSGDSPVHEGNSDGCRLPA